MKTDHFKVSNYLNLLLDDGYVSIRAGGVDPDKDDKVKLKNSPSGLSPINSNDYNFYPFVYKFLNRLPIGAFRSAAMARHIALAFLLSLLFCAQNIAFADFDCAYDCAQNIAYAGFDFYYLVLKWPGSYCKDCTVNGCCMPTTFTDYPLEEDFLIKGLYTYSDSGQAVTKCNTTKFYVNALRNLIDDLHVRWPSIKCPSDNGVSLWRDAWTNYGVCSGLNETAYFEKALQLRKKINMLSILKGHGIVPSDCHFYSPLYVETAIKAGLRADVGIKCSTNESGKYQIDEIYVCVDKTASKVINCPVLPKFICGQIAYLPTFINSMLKDTSSCCDPPQVVTCE